MNPVIEIVIGVASAVFAGAQTLTALSANKTVKHQKEAADAAAETRDNAARQQAESDRRAALDRAADLDAKAARNRRELDIRYASDTYESLVTRSVYEILTNANAPVGDIQFLKALMGICERKVEMLSPDVTNDSELSQLIAFAADPVQAFLNKRGVQTDTPSLDARIRAANDVSKYSWEGSGRYSKYDIITRIAERWIIENQLATQSDFKKSFGAELQAAVPARASEYNSDWVLADEQASYAKSSPLELDGAHEALHWRCGFKNDRIGVEVHKPIIEYFQRRYSYPIAHV